MQKSIHNPPCLNQVGEGCEDGFPRGWRGRLRNGVLSSHIGPHSRDECGAPIWEGHCKVQCAFSMPPPEHNEPLPLQGVLLSGNENT
jgi:hypothetical protein